MKTTADATIPSPPGPPERPPDRQAIDAGPATMLRRGPRHKADVYAAHVERRTVLVKDFRRKPAFWRWLGRRQLDREQAACRWLVGVDGVPRCLGRVDADALAFEWIDGGQLKTWPDRVERGAHYVGQLRAIVDRIHARGVAHLDLRSNNNAVVRHDGTVFVVDFASAVRLRPGGWAHRWLFGFLAGFDRSGLLKWKRCLQPGRLSEAEAATVRRYRAFSALWLVNRKQKPEPDQNDEPSPASDGA